MKKLISLTLITLFLQNNNAQTLNTKNSVMKYLDQNHEKLDPIEGIWMLSVEGTMHRNDSIIAYDFEEFRSEWAIVKDGKNRFRVVDINGAESEENATAFDAWFEKTGTEGLYSYTCNYKIPVWTGSSTARLMENVILDYGFYTSDIWFQETYNGSYGRDARQYWKFTWTKKYPFEEIRPEAYYSDWKVSGTGFFIHKDGYLATNYHVVVDANQVDIRYNDGKRWVNYKAKVVQTDKKNDLALLKIISPGFTPFESIPFHISKREFKKGEPVYTVGYDSRFDFNQGIKFTNGRISAQSGYQGNSAMYQTSVPFLSGFSGSPLFNYKGDVVGINVGNLDPANFENVAYAVKSKHLLAMIDKVGIQLSNNMETLDNSSDTNLNEMADQRIPFVVFIKQ